MRIRLARAARRYSSHAPLAPRFATTLNYTTSDVIQLAQSDEASAVRAFWQPLRDYRSLMRGLSERHAREELGLDGEASLAAAMRAESAEQRRARLASFSSFMAALTASGDRQAGYATQASNPRPADPRQVCYSHVVSLALDRAAAAAGRRSGGAFRQPVEVEVGDARRELSPADTTLGAAGFSIERHGAGSGSGGGSSGSGGGGGGGGEAGAGAEERYQRVVQELVRERTGASHVFCSPAKVRAGVRVRARVRVRAGAGASVRARAMAGAGAGASVRARAGAGGEVRAKERALICLAPCSP